jgi:hypothetical protein
MVQVVGIPNAYFGEELLAVVIPEAGQQCRFPEWVTLRMLLVALLVYHSHREHSPGCMCLLRLEIELGEGGDEE